MNINIIIIIIVIVLLISIYYFNKGKNIMLKKTSEHYNNFCSYNPNLTYEKDLDDKEIDRLINSPSQFKLLRHESIGDLKKFIDEIKTRQKSSSDDFASYGLLKSVIEASEENVFRDIQDPFKSKDYTYPRVSKKQDTIKLMENTNKVMSIDTNTNTNTNNNIDTNTNTNTKTIEQFENHTYEYKYDENDPEWKLENEKEYEYIDECEISDDEEVD